jgi:hypothetical protein
MNDNKKPSQIDYEHVTLILDQAEIYGLKIEVGISAKKYIEEGFTLVESYEMAYQDWIK